jgi:glycosyltransferase involved in cell wall biosynthesis
VKDALVNNLTVIVCAYTENRWNDLLAAVKSLQAQTLAPFEILVVIDHNPVLYERAAREIPGIRVLENEQKRGLSGARNTGIAAAKGELIAFMDEDATAAPNWLAQLSDGFSAENVYGVGGQIVPAWMETRPEWFPAEFEWVVGCTYKGMPTTDAPIRNLIGCNMAFRREVFQVVGGFREGIGRIGTRPIGCEETELCIRVKQHWKNAVLLYKPQAQVFHRVPAARSTWSYFRSRCYSEGLSKAQISQYVGSDDALASERTYTLRTLPAGVILGIQDGSLKRDLNGFRRAGAIVAGFTLTGFGYVSGMISRKLSQKELTFTDLQPDRTL